jgi:alkylation response protein AidB-like acyl-CoA dehydrogenase
MNFGWSEAQQTFRAQVRDAIARHRDPDWGPHDFELPTPAAKERCLHFCRSLAAEGLLTPSWPSSHGGRDASAWEQAILGEEMRRAFEPRGPQYMNTNWIGPAIMAAGTPDQQALHLPRMAAGGVFWCQGFSEPDAGSDLAALRARAVRTSDEYLINGQKTWTSYAHAADYCFLLARTDPDVDPRRGISAFLVPMDAPGIEVREIPNIAGRHIIHEVFFKDVRVDADCRLGAENEGWPIILAALANERIGIARFERSDAVLDTVVGAVSSATERTSEHSDCETLGRAYALNEAARLLNYVAVQERADVEHGGPRPAAAVSRVATTIAIRAVADGATTVLGQSALIDAETDQQLSAAVTVPITAGSLEMQLNNVSRLCLSLPRS